MPTARCFFGLIHKKKGNRLLQPELLLEEDDFTKSPQLDGQPIFHAAKDEKGKVAAREILRAAAG